MASPESPRILLSNERTLPLDPGCGVRQIVDIAIRDLSPAVNDPKNAVQAIDRLADRTERHPCDSERSGSGGRDGVLVALAWLLEEVVLDAAGPRFEEKGCR